MQGKKRVLTPAHEDYLKAIYTLRVRDEPVTNSSLAEQLSVTPASATNMVKKDYQRGVRTFATEWLSNGQVVERVYQAPDR